MAHRNDIGPSQDGEEHPSAVEPARPIAARPKAARPAVVPDSGTPGAGSNGDEEVRLPFFDSHRLTVDELRDELRERGEDPVGLKGVLVSRLLAHVAAGGSQELLVRVISWIE